MTPHDDDNDLTPEETKSVIIYALAALAVFVLYLAVGR